MNVKRYRFRDILLLSVIAIIFELLGHYLHSLLPGAGFYLSFSILICIIGMLRWGWVAFVIYPISGLVFLFVGESKGLLESILLYPVANGFIVLGTLVFRAIERQSIKDSSIKVILFVMVSSPPQLSISYLSHILITLI